jgi:antitoxin YefM
MEENDEARRGNCYILISVQECCTLLLETILMASETTYTALRENLASYLDQVTNDREVLVVKRRGAPDVAILPADELAGLAETAYLLRSPKNAQRLFEALRELGQGKGKRMTVAELRRSVGLERAG